MRYILYARKSSESEDRQVQSIDDQVSRLKELAKTLKLKIIDIYSESKSAKDPDVRPKFKMMLERIENQEADGILCWSLDRLSRNPKESGVLHWMLQKEIIKNIRVFERDFDPKENVLLFYILTGMANQYVRDLSKNTLRGIYSKLEKGWISGLAPLGYLNDKEEKIVINDPERFLQIKKMLTMMLTGNYTPPRIMNIANEEWGFRTRKLKRIGGNKLSKSLIYNIFTNMFYAGIIVYSGKEYQGKHEPMITLAEYDRIQMLLGRKGRPRPKTHAFPYTGMIRCEECGCLYTAETKTKRIKSTNEVQSYTYYHCTRKKKDVNCSQRKVIRAEELEAQIAKEISAITILPKFKDWALEILKRENEKEVAERIMIQASQTKALESIQRKLDRLMDLFLNESISEEEYQEKKVEMQEERTKLRRQTREVDNRVDSWMDIAERAFNFSVHAREAFESGDMETKKAILGALGQNPTMKDGKLNINLHEWLIPIKKNYPAIEKAYQRLEPEKNLVKKGRTQDISHVRQSWLPGLDSNQQPSG